MWLSIDRAGGKLHANDDFDRDDETAISLHDTAGVQPVGLRGLEMELLSAATPRLRARKLTAKEPHPAHEPKKGLIVKKEEGTGEGARFAAPFAFWRGMLRADRCSEGRVWLLTSGLRLGSSHFLGGSNRGEWIDARRFSSQPWKGPVRGRVPGVCTKMFRCPGKVCLAWS